MSQHVANRHEYEFFIDQINVRVIFRDITKPDDYSAEEIVRMRDVVEHDYIRHMKMFTQEDLCNIRTIEDE